MSDLYESIPPEQEIGYLQHAQEVIDAAAEPVIKDLGESAVKDAVELTTLDATSSTIGEEAGQIVRENGIAKQAQSYLDVRDVYASSKVKRDSMKYVEFKKGNLEKPQSSEPPEEGAN